MTCQVATIKNRNGIHCRPAALIAKACAAHAADIRIGTDGTHGIDAKSTLLLMGLGLSCGTVVTVSVSGPDEESLCQMVVGLLESTFEYSAGE